MNMRNKKRKIVVLMLCTIVLCGLFTLKADARAGGGSSGGHGGGGSHSSSHRYSNGRGGGGSAISIVFVVGWLVLGSGGTLIYVYKVKRANIKSRRAIKKLRDSGHNWDYEELQKRVEKAYFEIQECWRLEDAEYAAEYLSASLLENFKTKLGWMKVKNEAVVQRNVKLLEAYVVYVEDHEETSLDKVWYVVHGKMIGYYINSKTGNWIRGNRKNEAFYEYWRFIYEDGRWVLDKIVQKDEVDINDLSSVR